MPFGKVGSGSIIAEELAKAKRSRRKRPKNKPKLPKKAKKSVRKRA